MASPAPEFIIVGRVRKAHGIRGELVVEPITDAPEAIFAAGRRVFAGTIGGDLAPGRRELHIVRSTPFKGGLIVALEEIADRNAAELWRDRFLLVPSAELDPPADGEIYLHELPGMRVERVGGQEIGTVSAVYELPQGVMLDVKRKEGTVMIPFHEPVVTDVDVEARVIRVDPPDGLLD
jgi:16S rRNA processing protein RimM